MIQPPGAAAPIAGAGDGARRSARAGAGGQAGRAGRQSGHGHRLCGLAGPAGARRRAGRANSPYAAALLKHLAAGGYSFGDVMTMVSEEVYLKTKARQLPWVNSSLRRVLSFGKPVETDRSRDEAAIKQGPARAAADHRRRAGRDQGIRSRRWPPTQGVPLDKLYGMLKVLGVDTSDPERARAAARGRRGADQEARRQRRAAGRRRSMPMIDQAGGAGQRGRRRRRADRGARFLDRASDAPPR